jgi:hypothetical protein
MLRLVVFSNGESAKCRSYFVAMYSVIVRISNSKESCLVESATGDCWDSTGHTRGSTATLKVILLLFSSKGIGQAPAGVLTILKSKRYGGVVQTPCLCWDMRPSHKTKKGRWENLSLPAFFIIALMEKIIYLITGIDGKEQETPDFDIAQKALKMGCIVVEHKEIISYHYRTVVRVYISTELSLKDLETR